MAPAYDFRCDADALTLEVVCPMAAAGQPQACPTCAQPMRRLYDTTSLIVIRPPGYSLKPGDKDYWKGFDAPLRQPTAWSRGRGQQARPGPEYAGVGPVPD